MGADGQHTSGARAVQLARLDIGQTEGRARELLEGVRRKRGSVSPLFQAMAHSPVVMSTYLSWHAAAAGLSLPVALREQISIAVSAGSGCGQCVSAHTRFGREAGLSDAELAAAQDA
ncbi:MAG: carboxymuconolactone decarboxylase family protein, partial [Pseudomonadota bacterium]